MWLLDVNLPNGLIRVLSGFGFVVESTAHRGWRNLGNGLLAEAASRAGFRVILTRDQLFGESADKALRSFPDLAVVILRIKQSKESSFLLTFENLWKNSPIRPVPGAATEWP